MHYRVNGFITMLIIIFGIIQYIIKPLAPKKIGFILLMPALFILLLLGQLYTENLKVGWTLIERSLSILLIPFALISVSKLSLVQEKILIVTFIGIGLISSIYCISHQFFESYQAGSIYTNSETHHFLYNRFMHHRLSAPIKLHAVYFSLYIAMAITYIFHKILFRNLKLKLRFGLVILLVFFSIMIFLLKSAIISFALCLVLIIILWQKLKGENGFYKILFLGLSTILIILAFFAVKSKMEFINLSYDMTDPHMGMLAIRLSIWENAMAIVQSYWLLGVGTGDADSALLSQYYQNGFIIGYENDYNCHNMYLQYWIGNGIIGVGLFITYLSLLLRKAIKYKNVVFIGFLIIFALFSFTESTIRVQKGMVFFMVFSSLFYWKPTLWSNNRV